MFSHQYFSAQYFPPVWFAPGDDSHLTDDERYNVEWLGGGGTVYYGKRETERDKSVYSVFNKTQSETEKEIERIELGIIEKTKPIIEEKAKIVSRLSNAEKETPEYWALYLHEYLLNENISEIQHDKLLQSISDNAINQARIKSIESLIIQRQIQMELAAEVEYQRIIEEDMIFVFSMLAEM